MCIFYSFKLSNTVLWIPYSLLKELDLLLYAFLFIETHLCFSENKLFLLFLEFAQNGVETKWTILKIQHLERHMKSVIMLREYLINYSINIYFFDSLLLSVWFQLRYRYFLWGTVGKNVIITGRQNNNRQNNNNIIIWCQTRKQVV